MREDPLPAVSAQEGPPLPARKPRSRTGQMDTQRSAPFELDILGLDAAPEEKLVRKPMEGGGRIEYEMWDGDGIPLSFREWRNASGGEIRVYDCDGFLSVEMNIGESRKARPAMG